ncbi:proton-coupled amino acid transporter-like protein pathetic [Planococcus citri]|uniref:proton-coupled amino acid transporter-like protein pathetic n=1 Tax=Planococcus citri TaxID=170843 RepID=UPI0031F87C79
MVSNSVLAVYNCMSSSNQSDHQTGDLEKPPPCDKNPTKEESSQDYDPHSFGNEHYPSFFWGTAFNMFKSILGTGMLALPFAVKSVGYGVAIVGIFLGGCIYTHAVHLLMEVEYELCKKLKTPNLTFLGIVTNTFEQGPRSVRKFIPVAKFLTYFHYVFDKSITNSIYLITIGGNMQIIINHFCNVDLNIVSAISAIMIVIIPLSLIRNLKFLAPFSTLTSVFCVINVILIVSIPTDYDSSSDLKAIADITKFPDFFGLSLGAFMCTSIVVPLKNNMRYPKTFTSSFGVVNVTLSAVVVLYCIFGCLGYLKYGDSLQGNILSNLPPDSLLTLVVLNLYTFSVCISFILMLFTIFDTIWSNLFVNRKMSHPIMAEYALRMFICITAYCLAVILPDFKIMASLSGVMGTLMEETMPILLHTLMVFQKKKKTARVYLCLLKDLILLSICSFLFFAALIQVIRSIVKFYS